MLKVRPAEERGHANYGWLDTYHSFSFGDYIDRNHVEFSDLRVINEDRIAPGMGFGTHPHKNMEIISYIVDGAMEHRDSMGNGSVISRGRVQRMSAGKGVTHSEFNPSAEHPTHLIQIWIKPEKVDVEPSYEEREFPLDTKTNQFHLLVSPDASAGSLSINQQASLFAGVFESGVKAQRSLKPNSRSWIQVVRGELTVNGTTLRAGDGLAVSEEKELAFEFLNETELLLFELR